MEIYGKPYIFENGTVTRIAKSGQAYTCPSFDIRVKSFDMKRDVLVVGGLDYTEATRTFNQLGYTRYGWNVLIIRS